MIYHTHEEVLNALKSVPKGKHRAEILSIPQNRRLVQSSGAEVTLRTGKIHTGETVKEKLQKIYLGLIARLNAKTGEPDGIGALGGLSERTSVKEFDRLDEAAKQKLALCRDDVFIKDGQACLTFDMNIIRINNVLRETREELGNLGIYDYHLNPAKLELVDMPGIQDDNYIINIWNGSGEVWAVNPYCYTLRTTAKTLDTLVNRSIDASRHEQNSEAAKFIKLPLFEALKRYGASGGKHLLEDGRNAKTDYRYPHSWLTSWHIAAACLNHNDAALLQLMAEVQAETPYKISFQKAAQKMGKDLNFIASILKITPETIQKMEKISNSTMQNIRVDKNFRQ